MTPDEMRAKAKLVGSSWGSTTLGDRTDLWLALADVLERVEALEKRLNPRCPYYWGSHEKMCKLYQGHEGEHVFD